MKQTIAVVGTQWGDEGKGKVTNYLSQLCDVVVRFQGGDNAGHTIKFDNQTFALHLVPSGVFNPNTLNIIGNGVVINPESFYNEVIALQARGVKCTNLFVSDRAHVIFDYHKALDGALETKLGSEQIGTTKRGIGPTYTDKMARIGIRVADFISSDFPLKLQKIIQEKNLQLENSYIQFDYQDMVNKYLPLAQFLKPFVTDTISMINRAYDSRCKILFEGAQGTLLDIDFGTYPYVTSSNSSACGISSGSGIGPNKIQQIIGVTKAYSTRVGSGVFPTEFFDEVASAIREKGHEYGTTTGRPRRIGWLDCVILKHSAMVNGLTGLSVMLLDVLSGLDTLKIAYQYELDGQLIDCLPARIEDFNRVTPIYVEVPGWNEELSDIKEYDKLPVNAKKYLDKITELTGVPIAIVSVGPDQQQTIVVEKLLDN